MSIRVTSVGTGIPGPQGPQGPEGPEGPAGSGGSIQYSQTLIVDPDGSDTSGNGGPNSPFKTIQKAHDYAEENIDLNKRVIVKINAGTYIENLLITRPRINFVGLIEGISKATLLAGEVVINVSESIGGSANDFVSLENLLIAADSGSSLITISGSSSHSTILNNLQVFTSAVNAKGLEVINDSAGGNEIFITNCVFSNKESSATTVDLFNTSFASIHRLTVRNGTGKAMDVTSTNAVIDNSRFESSIGATTMIGANSSFTVGGVSLILANSWIVNPSANGNGIEIANGAITNVGQVAFSVGTAAGTGFAVKGVSGAVFINGNNLIVPGTNNKISTAITRVALGTSFTAA